MNRNQRRVLEKEEKRRRASPGGALLAAALAHRREGRMEQAVEGYRKVLEVEPESLDALMGLGTALAALGLAEEAAGRLSSAVRLAPRNPDVHQDAGVALATLGRWEEGVAEIQRAVTLAPSSAGPLEALGDVLVQMGRREEGAVALHRATALSPFSASAFELLHAALYDDRDLGPAIEAVTKALVHEPERVGARFKLAAALDVAGDARAAAQLLDRLRADERARPALAALHWAKTHRSPATRFFATTRELLVFGPAQAGSDGAVVAVGARTGAAARSLDEATRRRVHVVDDVSAALGEGAAPGTVVVLDVRLVDDAGEHGARGRQTVLLAFAPITGQAVVRVT